MNQQQIDEYDVVRNSVGLFDLSDSGKFYISGNDADVFLNKLVGGNIELMREGQIINTLFITHDGHILSIVWLLKDEDSFIIFTDAEKRNQLIEWLQKHTEGYNVQVTDKSDDLGCLALIGPKAQEAAREIAGDDIIGLPYLGFEHNPEVDCLLCRVGYTGEYEYRFILPKERCKDLKDQLMKIGGEYDLAYCSPAIFDILMLEMKSINQMKDLLDDTTPIQAGLPWMIDFRKDEFIGKEIVAKEAKSPLRRLLTLVFEDRVELPGEAKLYIGEQEVGFVVHKDFSPTLGKDIGLAYIEERFGWVGIDFDAETQDGERKQARTVSSPLFITKTVQDSAQ